MSTSPISNDFRKDFECPVCLEIPKSIPIFQCESGHIHCNVCHPKLQNCPICRVKLGHTRSLMSEKMFQQIQIKCSYEACSEMVLIQDVQNHEEKCEFRTVSCPVNKVCREKLSVNQLQKHLSEAHPTLISKQSRQFGYRIAVPSLTQEDIEATMVIDTGLDYFILKKKISGQTGLYTFTLKVIKSTNPKPLMYSLRVFNENQYQIYRFGSEGIVEDISELKTVPILVLSYEQAKQMAVDRKFILEIRVERLEELVDEPTENQAKETIPSISPNQCSRCSCSKPTLFKRALQKLSKRK